MLARLLRLVRVGRAATAPLWPPLLSCSAYAFVHRTAHLLANHEQVATPALQPAYQHLLANHEQVATPALQPAYQHLLAEVRDAQARLGPLAAAAAHCSTVTASYWPGLFACYDVPDLPRTNNDLEHSFGPARPLERRAIGRNGASPALVVRGAVRVVAAVATRLMPLDAPLDAPALALRPRDLAAWKRQRQQVEGRRGISPAAHKPASAAPPLPTWRP